MNPLPWLWKQHPAINVTTSSNVTVVHDLSPTGRTRDAGCGIFTLAVPKPHCINLLVTLNGWPKPNSCLPVTHGKLPLWGLVFVDGVADLWHSPCGLAWRMAQSWESPTLFWKGSSAIGAEQKVRTTICWEVYLNPTFHHLLNPGPFIN